MNENSLSRLSIFSAFVLVFLLFVACAPAAPPGGTQATLEAPTFDSAAGTKTLAFTLHLSDADAAATIWYSLDGGLPQPGSSLKYDEATGIEVKYTRRVRAIASKTGMNDSAIATADYHFLWSSRAAMPTARYGATAAVIGNLVYVMGGKDSVLSKETLVFDTVSDSWTTDQDMPLALYRASAVSYGGKIFVFGGYDGATALTTIYRFDPTAAMGSRWSVAGELTTGRFWSSAALVGGMAYVIGGDNGGSTIGSTERVDLSQTAITVNSTAVDAIVPSIKQHLALAIGGLIYLFGGNSGAVTIAKLDPGQAAGSQWTTVTTTPDLDSFYSAGGAVIGGLAYAVGGYWNIAGEKADTRAFDPSLATVGAGTVMTTARHEAAGAMANGTIVLFGGITNPTGPVLTGVVEQYDPAAEP